MVQGRAIVMLDRSLMTGGRSNLLTLALPRTADSSRPPPADNGSTLRGSLSVLSALDLLQWLCNNRQTWKVRLYGQGVDGDVVVLQGQLVDARWSLLRGPAALVEIVGCQYGFFELVTVETLAEGTGSLHGSSQGLLLNAVRSLDERNHRILERASSVPPPLSHSSSSPTAMSGEHSLPPLGLVDLGFAALRAGNKSDAKRYWREALAMDPENRTLQFNLKKLERLDDNDE
jgi:hypothetical protein